MKPLIGISCCSKPFGQFAMPNHAASDTYVRAVDRLMDAVPVLLPANGDAADIPTLLSRLDGIILTGSRSNVRPALYGGCPHPEDVPEDVMRDAVTLPLIRAALGAGLPVLAICRGMQELNVALGGTLHQRLQDLPGRLDHSTPMQPDARVRHGKAHRVDLVQDEARACTRGRPSEHSCSGGRLEQRVRQGKRCRPRQEPSDRSRCRELLKGELLLGADALRRQLIDQCRKGGERPEVVVLLAPRGRS